MITKYLTLLLFTIFSAQAFSFVNVKKTPKDDTGKIKIAIIDTGFGFNGKGHGANLCQKGHKDFTKDQVYDSTYNTIDPIPVDLHSHGTNVEGLIEKYAKSKYDARYCFIILKVYNKTLDDNDLINYSDEALKYSLLLKINVINYSGGGKDFQPQEQKLIKKLLDNKTIIVAAAGNEGEDLTTKTFYPALDDKRVLVVGNGSNGWAYSSSNYGKPVKVWEDGRNQSAYGITMTGSSQSTAIATGKIVHEIVNKMIERRTNGIKRNSR